MFFFTFVSNFLTGAKYDFLRILASVFELTLQSWATSVIFLLFITDSKQEIFVFSKLKALLLFCFEHHGLAHSRRVMSIGHIS
jgi:hypothetical protein